MIKEKRENMNKQYEDIRRYLNDEMSGTERNAFEKRMENDPFLADALEGYSLLNDDEAGADIKSLKGTLRSRIRGRNTLLYRVAAAVVVLIGISSVLLVRNLRQPSLEMAESSEIPKESVISEPASTQAKSAQEKEGSSGKGEQEFEKEPASEPEEKAFLLSDDTIREDEQADRHALIDEVALKHVDTVIVTDAVMAEVPVKAKQVEEAAPVAGVRAGKATMKREVADKQELVALADENVPESRDAQPASGKEEYMRYLEKEVIYPEGYEQYGEVTLKLKVIIDTDGSIVNVIIEKSPDKAFSDEAERLIREGPEWLPAMRDGKAVRDTIKLELIFF